MDSASRVEYRMGDCLEVLGEFPDAHFDSCVTDPPYGLEFMGKEWDRLQSIQWRGGTEAWQANHPENAIAQRLVHRPRYFAGKGAQEWHTLWAKEVLRVLKPGAHILSFGGTRTYHRMTCALEDVGFEIRDCLMWLYGTGFPKSLDVSKAIDKHLGKKRTEVVEHYELPRFYEGMAPNERKLEITKPVSPEARQWNGWGTALKPAYEPIVLARKPLIGTVAQNVLKHGTGGINVDGCRIRLEEILTQGGKKGGIAYGDWKEPVNSYHIGRWPSNVILDQESAKLVDEQSGVTRSEGGFPINLIDDRLHWKGSICQTTGGLHDEGGASRFFYIAKASRSEREKGLRGRPKEFLATMNDGIGAREHNESEPSSHVANFHPTVKPLKLMCHLVRLITPRGGICLDPFLGSGTTLLACRLEGFNGFGIEKEPSYESIIRERLAHIPTPIESFEEARHG